MSDEDKVVVVVVVVFGSPVEDGGHGGHDTASGVGQRLPSVVRRDVEVVERAAYEGLDRIDQVSMTSTLLIA